MDEVLTSAAEAVAGAVEGTTAPTGAEPTVVEGLS